MEDHYLKSHLKDLAWAAKERGYVTSSPFLTSQEIADVKKSFPTDSFVIYGGTDESERGVALFLPDFTSPEEVLAEERESDVTIHCLEIRPRAGKFAKPLAHRDYLGAILGLGIERDQVGDILIQEGIGYAFILAKISAYVMDNLSQIGNENVQTRIIKCNECPASIQFEERVFTVSSIRLDLVVAGAFHLSRETAQKYIDGDLVKIDSTESPQNSTSLKGGERISLRGKGKFVYVGAQGQSKKGKEIIKILLYR